MSDDVPLEEPPFSEPVPPTEPTSPLVPAEWPIPEVMTEENCFDFVNRTLIPLLIYTDWMMPQQDPIFADPPVDGEIGPQSIETA